MRIPTIFSLCCLLLASAHLRAEDQAVQKITADRETTFFKGPFDREGFLDYQTALNEHLRGRIKPEQNANVLLMQALGPTPEKGRTLPVSFYRWLGTSPLPEKGDYFIPLGSYLLEQVKIPREKLEHYFERQSSAGHAPWKDADSPHIAGWLRANEKPLALVVAASRRDEYYLPLVTYPPEELNGGLFSVLLPILQPAREVSRALSARAMLRTGRGEFDSAWSDILATHRLGRLIARGGTIVELLIGLAIDRSIADAELAHINHPGLTSNQIRQRLHDLQKLPPLSTVADHVDVAERVQFLDLMQSLRKGKLDKLEPDSDKKAAPLQRDALAKLDWPAVLRNGNRWYDRMVAALRHSERPARQKALGELLAELDAMKKKHSAPPIIDFLTDVLGEGLRKKRIESISDTQMVMLLPALQQAQQSHDRAVQSTNNLHVAFALAAFRRDHARYPATLSELSPTYLQNIPADLFTGRPLVYHPEANGYLLYSVGPNGKDDGGRGPNTNSASDDLSISVPNDSRKTN